jgi:hypothetical protein
MLSIFENKNKEQLESIFKTVLFNSGKLPEPEELNRLLDETLL